MSNLGVMRGRGCDCITYLVGCVCRWVDLIWIDIVHDDSFEVLSLFLFLFLFLLPDFPSYSNKLCVASSDERWRE